MELFLGILLGGLLFGGRTKKHTKCSHGISLKKKCKKCIYEYKYPISTSQSTSVLLSPSTSCFG